VNEELRTKEDSGKRRRKSLGYGESKEEVSSFRIEKWHLSLLVHIPILGQSPSLRLKEASKLQDPNTCLCRQKCKVQYLVCVALATWILCTCTSRKNGVLRNIKFDVIQLIRVVT
jgi:hypothetical protein